MASEITKASSGQSSTQSEDDYDRNFAELQEVRQPIVEICIKRKVNKLPT